MDDLTGLDWNSSKPTPRQKPTSANYYPTLRPTPPISGRSTPALTTNPNAPRPPAISAPRSNSSTPANDSFATLLSFNATQSTKTLSLAEQQKRLEEQKLGQQQGLGKKTNTTFGEQDGAFLETLGSGRTTPNNVISPPKYTATAEYGGHKLSEAINRPFAHINTASSQTRNKSTVNGEDDLLSGFGESTSQKTKTAGFSRPNIQGVTSSGLTYQEPRSVEEDIIGGGEDDPFGLGMPSVNQRHQPQVTVATTTADDDDILGLLGRPVSEFPQNLPGKTQDTDRSSQNDSHPQDAAIAELVDMGFSLEKSRQALESTESGVDVQAAVGWLLNQAHQETRNSKTPLGRQGSDPRQGGGRRRSISSKNGTASPVWQQAERHDARRQNSRSPANGEKDPMKVAVELGNNLFKTANSLWKTGTKKLNQAVSELNSDSDTSQPKWMKEAQRQTEGRKRQPQHERRGSIHDRNASIRPEQAKADIPDVTDEALMLENGDARPARTLATRSKPRVPAWTEDSSRDTSPAARTTVQETRQHRFLQQPQQNDPKTRLSRQTIEEQTSQAYISPARRKKAAPKPPSPEPDLLVESSHASTRSQQPSQTQPQPTVTPSRSSTKPSPPVRSPAPKRTIPPVSPFALQTSTQSRLKGSEAFKLGDYGLATTHYTSALAALPSSHPLTLPILTNRALSHSKNGDPKASIADATAALTLIGPSRGADETIDLGSEGQKEMSLFWGKAMTRKAEALEQLERWSEAASVWRSCVEANFGAATSIAGRNRCEKAANPTKPKPPVAQVRRPPPKPVPKQSALDALSGNSQGTQSTEAVSRLRAANLEAERVDDEKFALSDSVSARLQSWRAGKEGNLRALLASLETVLWPDAGWKKVGMSELILPGKVKVSYMKGIAKVHPDKVGHLQSQCQLLSCSEGQY